MNQGPEINRQRDREQKTNIIWKQVGERIQNNTQWCQGQTSEKQLQSEKEKSRVSGGQGVKGQQDKQNHNTMHDGNKTQP